LVKNLLVVVAAAEVVIQPRAVATLMKKAVIKKLTADTPTPRYTSAISIFVTAVLLQPPHS
jgi:hypothetical protein